MNVTEMTDTRLVIHGKGTGRWLVIFGSIFALVGVIMFVLFGQSATLRCNRDWQPKVCRIERRLLGLVPIKTIELSSLSSAYVDESRDDDGDLTYRVMLVTGEGRVPLTGSLSSGYSSKADMVAEISTFLEDREQRTLEVTQSGTMGALFSLIFVLVGGGVILGGINTMGLSWILDKRLDVVVKERRAWGRTKAEQYPLRLVTGARVGESHDSDGGSTYRVELLMASGETLPLTTFYTSGRKGKAETVAAIRQFLEVENTQKDRWQDW